MNKDKKTLVSVSAEMKIHSTAERVWPLLCPVLEYDWVKGWDCELIHSTSGVNELGCVFRTNFPSDGLDTWVTSRYEPNERLEFIRITEHRTIRYIILLFPEGESTKMTWTLDIVPLTERGHEQAQNKLDTFEDQMAGVEKELNHYLATGSMLGG